MTSISQVNRILSRFATSQTLEVVRAAEQAHKAEAKRVDALAQRVAAKVELVASYVGTTGARERVLSAAGELLGDLVPGDLDRLPAMKATLSRVQALVRQCSTEAYGAGQLRSLLEDVKGDKERRPELQDVTHALRFVTTAYNPSVAKLSLDAPLKECAAALCGQFSDDPFAFESPGNPINSVIWEFEAAFELATLALGKPAAADLATRFLSALSVHLNGDLVSLKASSQAKDLLPLVRKAVAACTDPSLASAFAAAL